jgi:pimeloyl-ACP methyl ester carboxylesterase
MSDYADLPGVKTWYEVEGDGDPLLLLHGGMCTNETWGAQRPALVARHRVHLPERRAHGHTPDVDGPLSYDDMAQDTVDFIEAVVGAPVHLVGWSDGGIVALLVAIARPDLVNKVVAVSANFLPAPEISAAPEMLGELSPDEPALAMFRSMYEAASPDGPEHWPVVVQKLVAMYAVEPNISPEALAGIDARTLVLVADDDLMTLEHSIALYRGLPNAELAVVPGTSHALLMEKADLCNRLILEFLGSDPVPTMMPIRRAAAPHGA